MTHFIWLAASSFVYAMPLALASVLVLGLGAWSLRRRDPEASLRTWREALIALATPLVLPLWATLTASAEENWQGGFRWASAVLLLLALAVMALSVWLLRRGRKQWYVFLPTTLTLIVAAALGLIVGVMSISNEWM